MKCPDCGRRGFKFARTLGAHRRIAHKIVGMSASAVSRRKSLEKNGNKPVKIKSLKVVKLKPAKEEAHEQETHRLTKEQYTGAVISGGSKAETIILLLAHQIDVPPRQFAADCANYILLSASR